MIPTLAVLVIVIRALAEGIKTFVPWLSEPVRTKWLVYALSFAAVWFYRLDVLAAVGMETPVAAVSWFVNALILAVATMGGHDLLDALAGKR